MPNFTLEIDPSFLPLFIVQIHSMVEQLKNELAIKIQLPKNDSELSESWTLCLLEDLRIDCQNLLFFLKNESLSGKPIHLELELAESILRASAAIRHKIRTTLLASFSDSEMETGILASGQLEISKLIPQYQVPFSCYLFLAHLQETILKTIQIPIQNADS